MHVGMYVCTNACVYVRMYVCMHVGMHADKYTYRDAHAHTSSGNGTCGSRSNRWLLNTIVPLYCTFRPLAPNRKPESNNNYRARV